MTYVPGQYQQTENVGLFLETELIRIAEELDLLEDGAMRKRYVLPVKPRDGLYYADGTDWDPGAGVGVYRFDETTGLFSTLAPTASVPAGTGTDNTLRWSGAAWVESALVKFSSAGNLELSGELLLDDGGSNVLNFGSPGDADKILLWGGLGSSSPSTDTYIRVASSKVIFNTPVGAAFDFRHNDAVSMSIDVDKTHNTGHVTTDGGFQAFGATTDPFANTTGPMFFAGVIGGTTASFGGYRWDTDVYVPTRIHGQPLSLEYASTDVLNISAASTVELALGVTFWGQNGISASAAIGDVGQVGIFSFMDVSVGRGRFGSYNFDTAAWQPVTLQGADVVVTADTSSSIQLTSLSGDVDFRGANVRATHGSTLQVRDATNADYLHFAHDGTAANITTAGTGGGDIYFAPAGDFVGIITGKKLGIFDPTNTDSIAIYHDGTDVQIDTSNTTDISVNTNTGTAVRFKLWDTAGTDFLYLTETGGQAQFVANANSMHFYPDFTAAAANTVTFAGTLATFATDVNITGQVDIALAAVSAPSYSFTGDIDTGLTSNAADEVQIATGAIAAVTWTEVSSHVLASHEQEVGMIAFATGGQGSATQITSSYNVFSTVATAGDSSKLPASFIVGTKIVIKNDGAAAMDVFPGTGDNLGAGVNTAVSVAAGAAAMFMATVVNTTWTQII